MRKLYIVKEHKDFDRIIKNGKFKKSRYYVIYYDDNEFAYDRFGISVGKKNKLLEIVDNLYLCALN